jgi:hypothetical protein
VLKLKPAEMEKMTAKDFTMAMKKKVGSGKLSHEQKNAGMVNMKELVTLIHRDAHFDKKYSPVDLACLFVCPQVWKIFCAVMKKHYASELLGQHAVQQNLKRFKKAKETLEVRSNLG